ncbi:hemoblobin-interacting domain-containing protein [Paenibacillus cymbidii]|uniref:hemoblobin-interacting domain-containing protein n=1 Tax=Paenibacillus cymbidii TaxID=1639034 RepID=UPI0010811F23|nr:S-layer homology domain-containing protein [Paenibacillus cymbidii]
MKAQHIWRWSRTIHLALALLLAFPVVIWGTQRVSADTSQWRVITGNASQNANHIALAGGKVYLLYNDKIMVRGSGDTVWSNLADLPGSMTYPIKLAVRGSELYVLDQGVLTSEGIDSKIFKSVDNGANWSEINAPENGYVGPFDVLRTIFFDPAGNLYALSGSYISITGDSGEHWTQIGNVPVDPNYTYTFTSGAVNSNGKLYVTFLKENSLNSSQQTSVIYALNGSAWEPVNASLASLGTAMQLTGDAAGIIHVAHAGLPSNLTTAPNIYLLDDNGFDQNAPTNYYFWTANGIAYDGIYYFIAGPDGIRTLHPTFGTDQMPPTLTADTSDNDTAHAVELTFADDADWRAAITDVTAKRNGTTVTGVTYSATAGIVTVNGLTSAGTYEIAVKAAGYIDAAVSQQINLAPSTWHNITSNLPQSIIGLSVDDAVYALAMGTPGVYYRSVNDLEWRFSDWSQEGFDTVFSFVSRDGVWYAADAQPMNLSATRLRISTDRGAHWDSYPLPYARVGLLYPLAVDSNGAVYMSDSKNVYKLDESRNWSQPIPVLPDTMSVGHDFTGIAVGEGDVLYANISEYNVLQASSRTSKVYQYDADHSTWNALTSSPSAFVWLYGDAAGGLHAAASVPFIMEPQPPAFVYRVDASGFTNAETLDDVNQARGGIAYAGGYYYIVDMLAQTIRTTNPNFFEGLTPPTLTADSTDNDDAHPLDVTFADDSAWRGLEPEVTITKGGSAVTAAYQFSAGNLHIEALPAGEYTIAITAAGYKKTSVTQTVTLSSPILTADTTDNDVEHDIVITFADNAVWRSAVTSVVYNGTTADPSSYQLSSGQLVFGAGMLPLGNVDIVVKAGGGYPDASVTQTIRAVNRPEPESPSPSPTPSPGANTPGTGSGKEIIRIDVLGGSRDGNVVSQAEIVRTTDSAGRKTDQVSLTASLAAQAVEALKKSGAKQAVIVVPDAKDEVASVDVSLPREALQKLTEAGIGLTLELHGATIDIPAGSLAASDGDLYFHVVPLKADGEQMDAETRAKADGAPDHSSVVGRPMTIETNLQSQPVAITLPLGDYPAAQAERLRIYVEHSDGTKEWLKGEPVADEAGGTAIRFTIAKFSTFTVIDFGEEAVTPVTPEASLTQAYVNGFEDGTFRPGSAVTRGQLAAMLDRLYSDTAAAVAGEAAAYADAGQFPAWAAAAIDRVTRLGVMDGYADGTFRAEQAVTRAEAAAIIARVAKLGSVEAAGGFTDTAGHWAAAEIAAAARAGLVNGYEDGSFAPDRELSRAEAAALINRTIARPALLAAAPMWPDVPATHWAFGEIQAAGSERR